LQRVADVPFRVGHHFASDLVNFGRGNNLKPAEIPYAETQRIYAAAATHFKLDDTKLPLTEAQFRNSLSPRNMINESRGLGGPQPAEVARMLATEKERLTQDRAWVTAAQTKLAKAARKLDAAFAQLRTEK
jgi:argininosuccinate lyase